MTSSRFSLPIAPPVEDQANDVVGNVARYAVRALNAMSNEADAVAKYINANPMASGDLIKFMSLLASMRERQAIATARALSELQPHIKAKKKVVEA